METTIGECPTGGHGEGRVVAAAKGPRGEFRAGQRARAGEAAEGKEAAPVAGEGAHFRLATGCGRQSVTYTQFRAIIPASCPFECM